MTMDNSDGDFNVFGNQDISEIFRSQNCVIINIVRCNDSKESTSDISKIWDKYKQVVPPRTVGLSKLSKSKRKKSLREPKLFFSSLEVRNDHIFLFEAVTQRLYSYGNWPKSAKIWPQELAEAGFFYLGNNLNLKCSSCGLQTNINDWKPTDKALDVHAHLNPKCEYLNSIGYSFDNKPKIADKNLVVPDGIHMRYPEYSVIDLRINSFTTWNFHNKQSPMTLAHSGYFYTGKDDIVRCFCCDLGLAEWDSSDDPWREHARHSHKCWFLNQMKGKEFVDEIQADWKRIYTPKHPAFEDKHTRMATFEGVWRTDIVQTADILTDAGFFYEGEEDTVRCHYCDGGLRHWEQNNIPWEEHARWFPFCKFVIKMKGREFIDEVKVKYEVQHAQENLDNERPLVNDTPALNNEPVIKSLLEMGFTFTDVTYAVNEYTKQEGNTSYTIEELLAILVERHEANKLQRTFTAEAADIHREETEQDTETVIATNRELKKSIMCIRCHTKEKCMLFVNCGHRVTCESCSNQIDYCPYCDVKIKIKLKTFLS